MAMKDAPVLVTGGCGFVGRTLVNRLRSDQDEIHIVDNLLTGQHPARWLPIDSQEERQDKTVFTLGDGTQIHFVEEDVRDYFKENDFGDIGDAYHLAAVIGGRATIDGEPLKVATDLSIDSEFFNWALDASPDNILYASSSAAYPIHLQNGDDPVKLKEEHISFDKQLGVPDMTYGWAKLTGEYQARFAAEEYGLSVAAIRPFSGYGGEQDFDYPVPAIARRAAQEEDPLTVWGSGTQVRDFVHIEDTVDAMIRAKEEISNGSGINIGTGKPTDFLELANLFAELQGYNPEIKNLPDKPEGVTYRCADTIRMERRLDWEPSISLREGMDRVLDSVKERIN